MWSDDHSGDYYAVKLGNLCTVIDLFFVSSGSPSTSVSGYLLLLISTFGELYFDLKKGVSGGSMLGSDYKWSSVNSLDSCYSGENSTVFTGSLISSTSAASDSTWLLPF